MAEPTVIPPTRDPTEVLSDAIAVIVSPSKISDSSINRTIRKICGPALYDQGEQLALQSANGVAYLPSHLPFPKKVGGVIFVANLEGKADDELVLLAVNEAERRELGWLCVPFAEDTVYAALEKQPSDPLHHLYCIKTYETDEGKTLCKPPPPLF